MIRRSAHRAFTLIELLLVLVILAVLAAVVVPKLTGRVEDSKRKATIAEISNLKSALDTYEQDNGHYPSTSEGLDALVERTGSATDSWHKLIDQVPVDKWNNPYTYVGPDTVGAEVGFNITSNGPDGTAGTEDDIDKNTK